MKFARTGASERQPTERMLPTTATHAASDAAGIAGQVNSRSGTARGHAGYTAATATSGAAVAPEPGRGEGRVRAVIDAVLPSVDNGRFAAKTIAGLPFQVTAHAFGDGHDQIRVQLYWRAEAVVDGGPRDLDGAQPPALQQEQLVEMAPLGNDVWSASFVPPAPGRYRYGALAWVDHFRSWRAELARRVDEQDIRIAARTGAALFDEAAERADGDDSRALREFAQSLRVKAEDAEVSAQALKFYALDAAIAEVADRHPDLRFVTRLSTSDGNALPLVVDRERAAFSAWYELFPRSSADEPGRHGTFRDVQARLPYVAGMGFDVVYLPPIHPIGREKRKGRNNTLEALPDDVGSPWAIGSAEGGHDAILPALGTHEDFRALVQRCRQLGMEIALDIAFQCAPDHPWVREHPQWFRWRPDGSVQYAENPPKKYQDIYPINFESDDWRALWIALKGVFDHWIEQGVEIFRVDNPHTKAFAFWEWAIGEIKREHPGVLFLSEAFTRPKVMHRLAKLGFSQSYTYYTWRHTREELTEYFTELTAGPGVAYFRPNVWPNTPDILNEQLHDAPRAMFRTRLLMAATLSGNYGIYGPAYELMERTPRTPGSEEYLDSEKYQIRAWNLSRPDSLCREIAQINAARRSHAALQPGSELRFLHTDNPMLLAYARRSADGRSRMIVVVNLDPHHAQSGWLHVESDWLGLDPTSTFVVDDLLGATDYTWHDGGNFVILDPNHLPAHLLVVREPRGIQA